MPTRCTRVTRDPRDINRIYVTVVGHRGSARLVRRDWQLAVADARWYAALLDAPRKVI